jgi:anti-anti-sigma regulatory factor
MREIVLSMGNKLDRNSGKNLRKAMMSVLHANESICFDASSLQHADATGLAELFAMIAEVLGRGGEAIVSGASDSMRALFELVQLDQVAEMHEAAKHAAPMYIGEPSASPSYGELQPQMVS